MGRVPEMVVSLLVSPVLSEEWAEDGWLAQGVFVLLVVTDPLELGVSELEAPLL